MRWRVNQVSNLDLCFHNFILPARRRRGLWGVLISPSICFPIWTRMQQNTASNEFESNPNCDCSVGYSAWTSPSCCGKLRKAVGSRKLKETRRAGQKVSVPFVAMDKSKQDNPRDPSLCLVNGTSWENQPQGSASFPLWNGVQRTTEFWCYFLIAKEQLTSATQTGSLKLWRDSILHVIHFATDTCIVWIFGSSSLHRLNLYWLGSLQMNCISSLIRLDRYGWCNKHVNVCSPTAHQSTSTRTSPRGQNRLR
jgi:hypothetical protein